MNSWCGILVFCTQRRAAPKKTIPARRRSVRPDFDWREGYLTPSFWKRKAAQVKTKAPHLFAPVQLQAKCSRKSRANGTVPALLPATEFSQVRLASYLELCNKIANKKVSGK